MNCKVFFGIITLISCYSYSIAMDMDDELIDHEVTVSGKDIILSCKEKFSTLEEEDAESKLFGDLFKENEDEKNTIDLNKSFSSGHTPLTYACTVKGLSPKVITLLLKNGVKINQLNKAGYAPLHMACRYSSPEVIEKLVMSGASVNQETKNGYPPIAFTVSTQPIENAYENTKALLEGAKKVHKKR